MGDSTNMVLKSSFLFSDGKDHDSRSEKQDQFKNCNKNKILYGLFKNFDTKIQILENNFFSSYFYVLIYLFSLQNVY